MKNSKSIEPKNLTAQLHYRGEGNPPGTHPSTAISNSFPGLEADFRNVWTHIFEGIVFHEASNLVVAVENTADEKIQRLVNSKAQYFLIKADGKFMVAPVSGPSSRPKVPIHDSMPLEWSNALAEILPKAGQFVSCKFQSNNHRRKPITIKLKVRHFFDVDLDADGKILNTRVVISRHLLQPGDLTQSLCSPWQNDYRECGCFYWAASRPDYVNVEPDKEGNSSGNNWLEKEKNKKSQKSYITDTQDEGSVNPQLVSYQELFKSWEEKLSFIIGGKDETAGKDGKIKKGKKKNNF
jgi:hypothetical protein